MMSTYYNKEFGMNQREKLVNWDIATRSEPGNTILICTS